MAKKAAFGGMTVSFKGCDDSMQDVFGSSGIAPSEMTKKLWLYIKVLQKLAGIPERGKKSRRGPAPAGRGGQAHDP